MASPAERLRELRRRRPVVDHVVLMQEHYGRSDAAQQAGAVTYFAFLSFFPVLALAVFVVGYVSHVYPAADQNLRQAINSVLPRLVGNDPGQISLDDVRSFSGLAGVVGLLGVLYSGLGWISALRDALTKVFAISDRERPGFVAGKLRDLVTLVVIGVVLLVSVALAGLVGGLSGTVIDAVGLGHQLGPLVKVLAVLLGLAADALLFFAMFKLLGDGEVPARALWSGAALGAVGFEVLKQLSGVLFRSTQGQPAFQAFGIALILVVWINYFSRVVLYAASWAFTAPAARAERVAEPGDPVQGPVTPALTPASVAGTPPTPVRAWAAPFAAGVAAALAAVAVARRR